LPPRIRIERTESEQQGRSDKPFGALACRMKPRENTSVDLKIQGQLAETSSFP
jgi:hypothetical protein